MALYDKVGLKEMSSQGNIRKVGLVVILGIISVYLYSSGFLYINPFSIYGFLPYLLFAILSFRLKNYWMYSLGLMAVVFADFSLYASIFLYPATSTAGLGMLVQPFLLVIAGALGISLGFIVTSLSKKFGKNTGNVIGFVSISLIIAYFASDIFSQSDMEQSSNRVNNDIGIISKEISQTRFSFNEPEIDIDNDGVFETVATGGGYQEVGVKVADGSFLWTFAANPNLPPNNLAYGDVNRDGEIEFYVADSSGLFKLDSKGKVVWGPTKDEIKIASGTLNEWYTDVAVIEGVNESFILALSSPNSNSSQYHLFDYEGNLIRSFARYDDEYMFDIVEFHGEPSILIGYPENEIVLLDLNGKKIFSYGIGDFPGYHEPTGLSVRFDANSEPYLAVVSNSSSGYSLSMISIFSPGGDVVYEEILATTSRSQFRVVEGKNGGQELHSDTILGEDYIYKFATP